MHGWSPYSDMHRERIRAHEKHVNNGGSMEEKPWDSEWWIPVLVEEIGEIARSRNEFNLGNIGLQTHKDELRKEAVQVGAMIAAWLDSLS